MTLELLVRSGARAGEREVHEEAVLVLGRHPLCDVRFHPELDRDVSSKHAELRQQDGKLLVVDLGSTNGTFVNGQRITGPTALADGDVLALGAEGPQVEIRLGAQWTRVSVGLPDAAPAPKPASPSAAMRLPQSAGAPARGGSTQERVRVAVKQETRKLTGLFAGITVLVAGGLGGAWYLQKQEADARSAELAAVLRRSDSLTTLFDTQLRQMKTTVAGLDTALLASKAESDRLRAQLAGGNRDPGLRAKLEAAQARQARLLSAAQMDYAAVSDASGKAVVLVAVEMPDGHAYSGSGFSVSASGTVITNRHLMRDEKGVVAKRVAVIFSDTKEWLPARIVSISDAADLAVLQIEGSGPYPKVVGVAEPSAAPRVGNPVAIIGYPLGTETPMEGSGTKITARSTLGAGTVSKTLADVLQIDAYAGQGSSGSPVFDASGTVVGVVYGGATESGGRIVYAVPVDKVRAELSRVR